MPILLNRMPFLENPSDLAVHGDRVTVRANQIIIWLSLAPKRMHLPAPGVAPFPAIVDTGHTHSFSLHERHLIEWAGMRPEALPIISAVRDRGHRLFLRAANIWIHPNRRNEMQTISESLPHLIEADGGIAVYPGSEFPRLPILGLRAIADNGLVLRVDGHRRKATLRTSPRWWPFV
jgi:hypothetical protein